MESPKLTITKGRELQQLAISRFDQAKVIHATTAVCDQQLQRAAAGAVTHFGSPF